MGTIDLSKRGGTLSGKVGGIVAYITKDGQQVVRAYVKPKNPKTPKQMAHRMKFALANKAISPLHVAIKMGHPKKKNPYRELVGKAYYEAIVGDYPDFGFDYGKVKVAEGKLQLPENIRFQFDEVGRSATFDWNPEPSDQLAQGNSGDKVNIVLFDSSHAAEITVLSKFRRSDGTAAVTIPEHWNLDTTHFWFFMSKQDLTETSESVYFGARE